MSIFGTGRREGILAVVVLVALAVLQNVPGLLLGDHRRVLPVAETAAEVDTGLEGATNQVVLAPAMRSAQTALAAGELPLWNRHARFGEPFAVTGAPLLYPPYWLLWLGDGAWLLDLVLCVHAALAAALMYRFLRALTLSRYVSFLGGALYGLGFSMTAALDRLPEAAAAALLPFVLEQTWRCVMPGRRTFHGALLGVGTFLMFATGGTTTAWLGTGLVIAMIVARMPAIESSDRGCALRAAGTGGLVALLCTAPMWLWWWQLQGSVTPLVGDPGRQVQLGGLLGVLGPGFFGDLRADSPTALAGINPGADPLELAMYPGALVLFVALLGLLRPKRTFQSVFWLVVGGVGILLTLDSPLSEAWSDLTGWYPLRPGAALVLLQVALVVLAGLGLENFFDAPLARRFATPITCAFSVVMAIAVGICAAIPAARQDLMELLAGPHHAVELDHAATYTAVRLIPLCVSLAALAILFTIWRRVGILRFKTGLAVVVLAEALAVGILCVPRSSDDLRGDRVASRIPADAGRAVLVGRAHLPPGSLVAAEDVAVVSTDSPRILDRTAAYLTMIDPSTVQNGRRARVKRLAIAELVDHPLFQAAGVNTAVGGAPFHAGLFAPLTAKPHLGAAKADVFVATRREPAPRARVSFVASFAASPTTARATLVDREGELPELVVLEGTATDFECRRSTTPPTVEWTSDGHNRIALRVAMNDGRGYLVVNDAWAPGWTVTVDGESADLLPANLAFRAVALREGDHEVVFHYRPTAAWLGLWLLALGAIAAVAAGIWGWFHPVRKLPQ